MKLASPLVTAKTFLFDKVVIYDEITGNTLIAAENILVDIIRRQEIISVGVSRPNLSSRVRDAVSVLLGLPISIDPTETSHQTFRGRIGYDMKMILPEEGPKGGIYDFMQEQERRALLVEETVPVFERSYKFGMKAFRGEEPVEFSGVFVRDFINAVPRVHPQHKQHFSVPLAFDMYVGSLPLF